jgi:cobalt/nickel transport protein
MKQLPRSTLALLLLALTVRPAAAHFNMLLPQAASVKRGEAVVLLYQWGHPFEHQIFDAPAPETVFVRTPDGTRTDLTASLEKFAAPEQPLRYRLRFTPSARGDYVFVLSTPPIWMKEDEEFLQDTVKVVLHVQAQKGWDAAAGTGWELLPLTRPYGLLPGMVFQARLDTPPKDRGGALVEIERYNSAPPKDLPPDELVTRTARTDPVGVVTCTLTEPGWWSLTAQRDGGKRERAGKNYPVRQRTTLWVFVENGR